MLKRTCAAAVACLVAMGIMAPTADAYDKYRAANYADWWAGSRNGAYPSFGSFPYWGSDCTNFVSQAMYDGGFSMVGGGSETSPWEWWIRPNNWGRYDFSHSWSVAADLRQFLIYHYPGGYSQGTAPGSSTNYWTPDAVTTGDLLFYDWGRGEGISHVGMQVGYGTDPDMGWNGNFTDQHQTDRRHAFWSLRPYNNDWPSTTIYFMHIAANNY